MQKIDLHEKFGLFHDHWSPKIIAELNGQQVKVAKLKGEFVWHHHETEDELFWVISGKLLVHFRDKTVELNPGELLVVPRGVEHKPEAPEEVQLVLFEPASTLNSGETISDRTVTDLDRI